MVKQLPFTLFTHSLGLKPQYVRNIKRNKSYCIIIDERENFLSVVLQNTIELLHNTHWSGGMFNMFLLDIVLLPVIT